MDQQLANYICRYFGHLMTAQEKFAERHLFAVAKITKGRSDRTAQEEAKKSEHPITELLSTDPEVLKRAEGGWEQFAQRTAEIILATQADKVFVNRCPQCGELARTPKARQCRFCMFDWHSTI
jgi:hypothetical protein